MRKKSGGLTYKSIIWLAKTVEKVEMISHYLYDLISTGPGLIDSGALRGENKEEMEEELTFLKEQLDKGIADFRNHAGTDGLNSLAVLLKKEGKLSKKTDTSQLPGPQISLRESLYDLRAEMSRLFEYMVHFIG